MARSCCPSSRHSSCSLGSVPSGDGTLKSDADLEALQELLGFHFTDADLLRHALRHSSWCAENGETASNERLEFLGDAVVELTVRNALFALLPDEPEGELSKTRRSVVNTYALSRAAARAGLGDALLLGRGEEQSGGRSKPSLLCNTLEALVGAAFLDSGWEGASQLVLRLVDRELENALSAGPGNDDPKTRLQELAAKLGSDVVEYSVSGNGPDHERWFHGEVSWMTPDGVTVSASGEGQSKKVAEQQAAAALLEVIESQPGFESSWRPTSRTGSAARRSPRGKRPREMAGSKSNNKNGAGHA